MILKNALARGVVGPGPGVVLADEVRGDRPVVIGIGLAVADLVELLERLVPACG